ncbi:MAG: hypothetical protein U0K87_10540 [Ruminococcus sp.]|nr:hypothetical protein [Ruminococcus sp.]
MKSVLLSSLALSFRLLKALNKIVFCLFYSTRMYIASNTTPNLAIFNVAEVQLSLYSTVVLSHYKWQFVGLEVFAIFDGKVGIDALSYMTAKEAFIAFHHSPSLSP